MNKKLTVAANDILFMTVNIHKSFGFKKIQASVTDFLPVQRLYLFLPPYLSDTVCFLFECIRYYSINASTCVM